MCKTHVIAAATILLLGGGASAQDLVVNGDFDTDVAGWQLVPLPGGVVGGATLSHDPTADAMADPGSGALLLDWSTADPTGAVVSVDVGEFTCNNAMMPSTQYRYGFANRGVTTALGHTSLLFCAFDGPNCTLGSGCAIGELLAAPGSYDYRIIGTTTSATTQSFRLVLRSFLVPDGGGGTTSSGSVLVDKVFARATSGLLPYMASATVNANKRAHCFLHRISVWRSLAVFLVISVGFR